MKLITSKVHIIDPKMISRMDLLALAATNLVVDIGLGPMSVIQDDLNLAKDIVVNVPDREIVIIDPREIHRERDLVIEYRNVKNPQNIGTFLLLVSRMSIRASTKLCKVLARYLNC